MNTPDLDADTQVVQLAVLVRGWYAAYESGIAARAEYQTLARREDAGSELMDRAWERLDRAEARKARVLLKIERLQETLRGRY